MPVAPSLAAVAVVIDAEGGVESFKAGDSFVMPRGFKCTWDVKEPVRKLYVVLKAESYRD